jgi:hypothetical protein
MCNRYRANAVVPALEVLSRRDVFTISGKMFEMFYMTELF